MEDLISREEIMNVTNIGLSQFKTFRRHGLIDGYVKKISVLKRNEKKSKQKGREVLSPAGFNYLYPRAVLIQISWILEQKKKGKNLMEIHNDFIRKKIQENEDLRRRAHTYEKIFSVPASSSGDHGLKNKLIGNAITELTERIKQDNSERDIKMLVFLVEPEKHHIKSAFSLNLIAKLDVENSQF